MPGAASVSVHEEQGHPAAEGISSDQGHRMGNPRRAVLCAGEGKIANHLDQHVHGFSRVHQVRELPLDVEPDSRFRVVAAPGGNRAVGAKDGRTHHPGHHRNPIVGRGRQHGVNDVVRGQAPMVLLGLLDPFLVMGGAGELGPQRGLGDGANLRAAVEHLALLGARGFMDDMDQRTTLKNVRVVGQRVNGLRDGPLQVVPHRNARIEGAVEGLDVRPGLLGTVGVKALETVAAVRENDDDRRRPAGFPAP